MFVRFAAATSSHSASGTGEVNTKSGYSRVIVWNRRGQRLTSESVVPSGIKSGKAANGESKGRRRGTRAARSTDGKSR